MPADDFKLRSIAVAAFGPSILFGLAEGAIFPVLAVTALQRGTNEAGASLIVAMIGIGSILSNIPAGMLTTRIGERWSLVLASVISALGLSVCILNVGVWLFGIGVLFIGVASSVYNLARQSYLTEAVPVHMRARALSTLGGTMRIGVFMGPFLGALAMQFLGVDGAYWVALAAIVGAGVLSYGVPELEVAAQRKNAATSVSTVGMVKSYWRTFATLGTGVLLLSAIRQTRQVVIPLWATHLGLSPTESSIIYGIAGAIDMLTFYPAGKIMDHFGRQWVAVPSMLLMGLSFVLMPLTTTIIPLTLVSMLMGMANGVGSGIVMTLGADTSPSVGRPTFLGIWRELSDGGSGLGPLLLSGVTALSSLALGIVVSGLVGFAAAAALWKWVPRLPPHRLARGRMAAQPAAAGADGVTGGSGSGSGD